MTELLLHVSSACALNAGSSHIAGKRARQEQDHASCLVHCAHPSKRYIARVPPFLCRRGNPRHHLLRAKLEHLVGRGWSCDARINPTESHAIAADIISAVTG